VNIVGVITASAAGLAAALAGANLYISGRRELNKWTRESLVESLVIFLDTSFKLRSTCRQLLSARSGDKEHQELIRAVISGHDLETETLTRLRLLASSRVVRAAENLHTADHNLAYTCFQGCSDPATLESSFSAVRQARASFIESARFAFRLKDSAPITHRHDTTHWYEIVSSISDSPSEQRSANGSNPRRWLGQLRR
jgi:hypothetical protein